jgi:hypothetical protein
LLSRLVAAIVGGYALASLAAIASLALPLQTTQAVITGQLVSFLVYAGAVVWVFAVRSARRAWLGLLLAAVPLLVASSVVYSRMHNP